MIIFDVLESYLSKSLIYKKQMLQERLRSFEFLKAFIFAKIDNDVNGRILISSLSSLALHFLHHIVMFLL